MRSFQAEYDEWETVFWIAFVVLLITLITYMIWGSAEVQPWNDNVNEDNWMKRAYRRCSQPKIFEPKSQNDRTSISTTSNNGNIPFKNENKSEVK